MLRLCIVLLIITALSLSLAWVADEPGRVIVDWAQYHIETSVLVLVAASAALGASSMAIYGTLRLLLQTPHHWSHKRLAKRQTQGLEALTEAFAAIATQDTAEAKKQIGRAQLLLPHQPLPMMLAAQVARQEGNESQARLYLEKMSKSKATGFLALRGLMENARRAGDDPSAVRYGEEALALKPQDPGLIKALAGLYAKQNRTQHALALLENAWRKRALDKDENRRLSAYALYENAQTLIRHKREDFAIAVLEDVLRKQSDFAPAGALLAATYTKKNETKRALKILQAAWKRMPHPTLSEALIACYEASTDREKVRSKIQKITQAHPDERESRFLSAMLALRERDLTTARSTLQQLAQGGKTVRVCTLMSELEHLNNDHEQAADWLKRASDAVPDPAWDCESCRYTNIQWHLTCPGCGNVGSMRWK
jgi:HemY protein